MKINVKSYLWLVFAGLIGLSSCSSDEEETPAPTISILTNSLGNNQTGGNAATGDTVTINITAEASEGISKLTATKTVGGSETTLPGYPVTKDFTSPTKNNWNATYVVTETSGSVVLKFSVEDKKGKISSKSFTIKVADLSNWSAKLLGAQSAAAGSYFASSTGTVFTSADAQQNVSSVDISYAFLTQGPTLLSWAFRADPSTGLTATVPAGALETKFAATSLTATDFISISSSSDAKFTEGVASVTSSSGQSVLVEQSKVYAFMSGSKKGLVHIDQISTGLGGSVNINVKVQK
jgi:hypothetical protein